MKTKKINQQKNNEFAFSMYKNNPGRLLKTIRVNNQKTLEQVSKELNLSTTYICMIERESRSVETVQTILKFSKAYKIHPVELFKTIINNKERKK